MRLFISLTIVLFSLQTFACTVFKVKTDSTLYIGSNEDWGKMNSSSRVWFTPKTDTKYAVSYFGFDIHQGWAQSGLNEHGLFFDGADTPTTRVKHDDSKPDYLGNIFQKIMEECKDLEEALTLFQKYNVDLETTRTRGHMIIVDKNANSAVIEWKDGDIEIIRGPKDFQVITNFTLSNNPAHKPTCDRYHTCRLAKVNKKLNTIEDIDSVLNTVSQEGEVTTAISKTYDLTNGILRLNYPHINDTTYTIDIYNGFRDTTYYINLPPPNPTTTFLQPKLYDLNDTLFFDENWVATSNKFEFEYFRITETLNTNDSISYLVKDYYSDGTQQMTGHYNSVSDMVLGFFEKKTTWYYQNGKKMTEGAYITGKKNGVWNYWTYDGFLYKTINFENDLVLSKEEF